MRTTNGALAPPDPGDRVRLLFSPELERSFCGGVIQCAEEERWERIEEAMAFIKRQDFHSPEHRQVFDAFVAIREKGLSPSLEPVVAQLEQGGKFTDSFVRFDVEQMLREACRPLIPLEPAKQIKELAQMRALNSATHRVTQVLETATDPGIAWQRVSEIMEQVRPPTIGPSGEVRMIDLLTKVYPKRVPVMQYFFNEGNSYLIAGSPKSGKSVFVMQCAIAIAAGKLALGGLYTGQPRDVIYVCLDDGEERAVRRARNLVNGMGISMPPTLTLMLHLPPVDQGGLQWINDWATKHPGGAMFIDLLENIRPIHTTGNIYRDDYQSLRPISDIAHSTNCLTGVVHHIRKYSKDTVDIGPLEMVSGSNGLMGAVDTGVIFHPKKLEDPLTHVSVSGRDTGLATYDLEWDDLIEGWRFVGSTPLGSGKPRPLGAKRQAILDAVQQASTPLGANDIAKATGEAPGPTRRLLRKMFNDRQIAQYADHKYDHPAEVSRRSYPIPLVSTVSVFESDDEDVDEG